MADPLLRLLHRPQPVAAGHRHITLPIGTAYAVWVGMGAVGTAICGIAFFGEPANIARVACLSLIVAGVVGLKLFSPVGH